MNTMIRARTGVSLAVLAALSLFLIALSSAGTADAASSGGIGTFKPNDSSGSSGDRTAGKYDRLWERVSNRDRRWAKRTAECESGGDPRALGAGGLYRGAFQFMRSTWKSSPKSPGGDPIDYSYRTQAVVAVALKKQQGTSPWPVCG